MHDPRIPLRGLLAYGGPILGLSYLLFFVQFYFLKYATDVLLLSPAVVGGLFAVAKLYDAVSDPVVGSASDRLRTRWGRRRPLLVAALPLLVLGFAMLWQHPAELSGRALLVWIALGLFGFYTAFTLYTLPHMALGAELSRDSHERTRLFGARQMSFTLGMLVSFAAMHVAMNADDPRAVSAWLAIPTALAAVALLAVTPLAVREPDGAARRGGTSLRAAARDVWRNRPARLLFTVQLVESTGMGAVGAMAPFVAEYLLRRPDVAGPLPAAYVLASVASVPFWVRISRSHGRRETWLVAMGFAAAAFGGMLLVGENDVALIVGLLVVAGFAMGCGGVLGPSILADVIDADERLTGERKEGAYSAAMTFMLKVGTSLATAASGVVLSAVGFQPNAEQSEASLWGIRLLFGGLPCLGFLIGATLFSRFTLEPVPVATASHPVTNPSAR